MERKAEASVEWGLEGRELRGEESGGMVFGVLGARGWDGMVS